MQSAEFRVCDAILCNTDFHSNYFRAIRESPLLQRCFMYRELIEKFIKGHKWAKVQQGCDEHQISSAEEYVGYKFPDELKNLLRETNGDHWFLLSTEEIINNVKSNREIYPEYLDINEFEEKINRYIFFATNGCGDYYCYRILPDGEADTSAIYIWEHELFEIRKVADNIADLITKYYNNET